jgi:hypothetical protein
MAERLGARRREERAGVDDRLAALKVGSEEKKVKADEEEEKGRVAVEVGRCTLNQVDP